MSQTSPSAVSRVLRAGGLLPVPRTREGVHVSRSFQSVSVAADLDTPSASRRLADDCEAILTAKGYVVERTSETSLSVTR